MCGVFGFIGQEHKSGPTPESVERIALTTERRGPDAWGVSWIDPHGTLRMFKKPGKISEDIPLLLSLVKNARAFIGHTRYATHGAPEDNANNHPHSMDGGWYVHNGVVRNYDELAQGRHLLTDCDSEIIGKLFEESQSATRPGRLRDAVEKTRGSLVVLALFKNPLSLVIAKRGNPLRMTETGRGVYFASLEPGMPGNPMNLTEDRVFHFALGKGGKIDVPKVHKLTPEDQAPKLASLGVTNFRDYRGG